MPVASRNAYEDVSGRYKLVMTCTYGASSPPALNRGLCFDVLKTPARNTSQNLEALRIHIQNALNRELTSSTAYVSIDFRQEDMLPPGSSSNVMITTITYSAVCTMLSSGTGACWPPGFMSAMSKTMFGTSDISMATLRSWFPDGKYGVISSVDAVVDLKAAAPSKAAAKDEPFYKTTWGIVGISEACILVVLVIFALVFYMKGHDNDHEQRDLESQQQPNRPPVEGAKNDVKAQHSVGVRLFSGIGRRRDVANRKVVVM